MMLALLHVSINGPEILEADELVNSFPTTHILYASYCNQLSASLLMLINIAHYWRKLGYVCK